MTQKWAGAFGATGPIDSTWTLGSTVLWRNAKGEVYVRGNVTAVSPLAHGDFGKLANGEKLYPLVVWLWDRLLPRIRELAQDEA